MNTENFLSIIFGMFLGFVLGALFTSELLKKTRRSSILGGHKIIVIPPKSVSMLNDIQRYMEFQDVVTLVRHALAYFHLMLEYVKKDGGEIILRQMNGEESKVDPITLIVGETEY